MGRGGRCFEREASCPTLILLWSGGRGGDGVARNKYAAPPPPPLAGGLGSSGGGLTEWREEVSSRGRESHVARPGAPAPPCYDVMIARREQMFFFAFYERHLPLSVGGYLVKGGSYVARAGVPGAALLRRDDRASRAVVCFCVPPEASTFAGGGGNRRAAGAASRRVPRPFATTITAFCAHDSGKDGLRKPERKKEKERERGPGKESTTTAAFR